LEDSRSKNNGGGGVNASSTITSITADTVITIPLRRSKAQEEGNNNNKKKEAIHLFSCFFFSYFVCPDCLTHFPFLFLVSTNTHRNEGDDKGECGSRYPSNDPAEAPAQTAIDGCRSDRHGGIFATTHISFFSTTTTTTTTTTNGIHTGSSPFYLVVVLLRQSSNQQLLRQNTFFFGFSTPFGFLVVVFFSFWVWNLFLLFLYFRVLCISIWRRASSYSSLQFVACVCLCALGPKGASQLTTGGFQFCLVLSYYYPNFPSYFETTHCGFFCWFLISSSFFPNQISNLGIQFLVSFFFISIDLAIFRCVYYLLLFFHIFHPHYDTP
jgi:hypothetical protein